MCSSIDCPFNWITINIHTSIYMKNQYVTMLYCTISVILSAAKKLISSGILPSGSGTFDDLHEDELYGKPEASELLLLEDETEPENLMEGKLLLSL